MRNLVYPIVAAVLFAVRLVSAQTVQDTAFTYQGELLQNNLPVTASVDMVFTLYDAPASGNVIGAPITLSAANSDPVQVVDGLFTVSLDFGGAAFIATVNDARWLAVSVDGNALSPRTKIENAPYALTAQLAYGVLAGSIGTAQINAAQVQRRVSGICASGSSISVVNQDGSVSCQSAGSGTITGVTPASGSGIIGGGTSGSVSIDTDLTVLQKRVGSVCAGGQAIRVVNADGTVTCQAVGSTFTLPYSATQSNAGPLVNVTNTDTSSASTALQGTSNSTAANVSAVEGVISSSSGGQFSAGVRGINNSTSNVGVGVYGTAGNQGVGVEGIGGVGVVGSSTVSPGTGFGAGVQGFAQAVGAIGVSGYSMETTTDSYSVDSDPVGVMGRADAPSGIGVFGHATSVAGGPSIGVYGQTDSSEGVGVYGMASGNQSAVVAFNNGSGPGLQAAGTPAAEFGGPVIINGSYAQMNPDIELTVISANENNPSADIVLLPWASLRGYDISVGGTSSTQFGIYYTPDNSGYTQVLGLDSSGNLNISGGTATKPGGGSWSAPSDIRLKRDVQPLDHVLDKLLQLRGVSFEYANPDGGMHPAGRHNGFIAQEVQVVFPDWVGQTADGYLSVGPQGFEAMTVEGLRELRAEKDAEIDSLHAQLDELSARLNRLENARETQP